METVMVDTAMFFIASMCMIADALNAYKENNPWAQVVTSVIFGSPGEIRTPVWGSKGPHPCPLDDRATLAEHTATPL